MCYIDAHAKQQPSHEYDSRISGGKAITSILTTESLDSLGATFDFIFCWVKCFDKNYQAQLNRYIEDMQDFLRK